MEKNVVVENALSSVVGISNFIVYSQANLAGIVPISGFYL